MSDGFRIAEAYVEVTADTSSANTAVDQLRAKLEELSGKTIGVDIGDTEAKTKLAEIKTDLEEVAAQHPDITVRVDADKALVELAAVKDAAEKVNGKTIKANVDSSDIRKMGDDADNSGRKLDGMGNSGRSSLAPLIALAVASSGALFGIVPAALGVGAALVGVGFAFSGISAALKGYQADQEAATTSSSQSAATQLSNATAIRNAQQSIADAQKNLARVAEDTASSIQAAEQKVTDAKEHQQEVYASAADAIAQAERRVSDAETQAAKVAETSAESIAQAQQRISDAVEQRDYVYEQAANSIAQAEQRVADAQRAEQNAQEALTNAREQAAVQLEDLNRRVSDMALNEEGASLAIEQSQARLKKVLANPLSTDLEKRQAQYEVDSATQRLKDLQETDAETRKQADEANAKGVEGDKSVVSAKNQIISATEGVANAQQAEAKAVEDASRQRAAADRTVGDAETALAKTVRDAADQQAAAARTVSDAKAAEAKEYQNAASQRAAADRSVQDAQKALAQAEETAARQRADAAEQVAKAVQSLSDTQAQQAASAETATKKTSQFAEAMAKLTPAGRDFVNQLLAMQPLLDKLKNTSQSSFLPGLTDMLKDSEGLFPIFNSYIKESGTILGDAARQEGELFKSQAFKDNLDAMFKATEPVTRALGDMMVTLSGRLVQFGKEMTPAAQGFADFLDGVTKGLSGFFDGLAPHADSFKRIWDALGKIFSDLLPILGQLIGEFSDYLAPALEKVADWLHNNHDKAKDLIEIFAALYVTVKGINVVKSASDWIGGVITWLGKLGGAAEGSSLKIQGLKNLLMGGVVVGGAAGILTGIGALAPGQFGDKGQSPIQEGTNAAGQIGKDVLTGNLGDIWTTISKEWDDSFKQLESGDSPIQRFGRWIQDWGSTTVQAVEGFFSRLPGDVGHWFTDLYDKATGKLGELRDSATSLASNTWNAISGWFSHLGTDASNWFGNMRTNAGNLMGNLRDDAESLASRAWNNISGWFSHLPADASNWFGNAKTNAGNLLGNLRDDAGNLASAAWNNISGHFSHLATDASNWFGTMRTNAGNILGGLRDDALNAAGALRDGVVNAFNKMSDLATTAWNRLRDAAAIPIRWIIDPVYNRGILPLWNKVVDIFGGNRPSPLAMPFAGGGVLPGYAPGRDTVPALLSPGEGILTPEAVQMVGAHNVLALNQKASGRKPGATPGRFAAGGIVGDIAGFVSDPVGAIKSLFAGVLGDGARTPGVGMFRDALASLPAKVIDMAIAKVKSLISSVGSAFSAAFHGSPDLAGWIAAAIGLTGVPQSWAGPLSVLIGRESGGNPNAINNWDSNAAAGHPSQGLMQTIPGTFNAYHQPGTSWNILDPVANIAAGINYIKSRYGSIFNVQQANPNLPPKGYDSGGLLAPGVSTVYNGTGRPERVLSAKQTDAFDRLVSILGKRRGADGVTVNVTQTAGSPAETGRFVALALRTVG